MAEVRWIKLAVDIFDNRKIRQIEAMPEGDTLIVTWLKLLTLAGNTNDNGLIYLTREIPFTDQLLSTQFNTPLPIIKLALATFQRFGMIEIIEDIIHISNWEKYQNTGGMDRIREQNRIRQKRWYDSHKTVLLTDAESNVIPNVMMTQPNATDIDKERELEKEKDRSVEEKPKRKRFSPPTVDEVESYCKERQNHVDAQRFVDYYESKGWTVGKYPMKDWKAAVRTWEHGEQTTQTPQKSAKRGMEREGMEDDWGNISSLMNRPIGTMN